MSRTRDAIVAAYDRLERASDESGSEAAALVRKAYDAALAGEKGHRRFGPRARYRESAETAARYFTVKWFLDPANIKDARSAAAVRLDCLYASALREVLLESEGYLTLRAACLPVLDIDYSDDIAG